MIPHSNQQPVETNLTNSAEFSINQSAKMFSILSDKIYTDKITAVIREMACNALDTGAHFHIAVPSALDPTLTIRDFGPGISHSDMLEYYTSVFYSTKSDDNNVVGGFGLGRMSVFSYTDAFTVTSTQGGYRRVYAVYRNEQGIPAVALADEGATDQKDGLEVKIPVQRGDFSDFTTKAQKVLRWFRAGSFTAFGFDAPPVEWLYKTELYGVLAKSPESHNLGLMGPVAYKLTVKDLATRVIPFFPIGSMDLSPSREEFSYNPATIECRDKTVAAIKERLRADIHAYVTGFSKRVDRLRAGSQVNDLIHYTDKRYDTALNLYPVKLGVRSKRSPNVNEEKSEKSSFLWYPDSTDHPLIVVRDTDKLWVRLTNITGPARRQKYLIVEPDDVQRLRNAFENDMPPMMKLSEFPAPERIKKVNYDMRVLTFTGQATSGYSTNNQGRLRDSHIWWPVNGFDPINPKRFSELMRLEIMKNVEVIGLSQKAQKEVDLTELTPLEDYVTADYGDYAALSDTPEVLRTLIAQRQLNDNPASSWYKFLSERSDFGTEFYPELQPIRELFYFRHQHSTILKQGFDKGYLKLEDPIDIKPYVKMLRRVGRRPLLQLAAANPTSRIMTSDAKILKRLK